MIFCYRQKTSQLSAPSVCFLPMVYYAARRRSFREVSICSPIQAPPRLFQNKILKILPITRRRRTRRASKARLQSLQAMPQRSPTATLRRAILQAGRSSRARIKSERILRSAMPRTAGRAHPTIRAGNTTSTAQRRQMRSIPSPSALPISFSAARASSPSNSAGAAASSASMKRTAASASLRSPTRSGRMKTTPMRRAVVATSP